jgi:uncharacterized membrane protein HdeD (DUF308 family)
MAMRMTLSPDEERAATQAYAGSWWMFLVAGLIGIFLGAWAVGDPGRSVLLLVSIIGIWAIFKGAADLVASFTYHRLEKELTA